MIKYQQQRTKRFQVGQQVYFHIVIPKWWIKRSDLLPEDTNCLAKGIIAATYKKDGKRLFKIKVSHVATKTIPSNPQLASVLDKIINSTVKRSIDQIHPSITTWMEQVYQNVYWSGLNPTQQEEITNRILNRYKT